MSHITHPSTLYPVPFSVKNLMAGLIGVGISLVLFFMASSSAVAKHLEPVDQGQIGQEDQAFRDLIFDETHHLWTAEESYASDPDQTRPGKLPHVSSPPPTMEPPSVDDEYKK